MTKLLYQMIKNIFYFLKFELFQKKLLRYESNKILKNYCKFASGRILNIGSGNDSDKTGNLYRNYFGKNSDYTTLEYEEGQSDLVADIQNMPIVKDKIFDCVFCIWVLEHVEKVDSAIKEISRILDHEGKLIFAVPLNVDYHGYPRDFWRFSESDIKYLLIKHNFRLIDIKKIGEIKKIVIDPRLKFYKNSVDFGPDAHVAIAQKN
tara:strand:- start:1996 stop:2613 length:618 start_codon:yes stop_codon:yes gene_type:complete